MNKLRFFYFFICILGGSGAYAASFDCNKAGTQVEQMICDDSVLSVLDEKLSMVYKKTLKNNDNKKLIKSQKKKWLKNRNICNDVVCLEKAYQDQINVLNGFKHIASDLGVNAQPNQPVKYMIKEGNQYALCRDLVPYLKKRDEMGGGGKKSNFIVSDPKFSVPKWKEEKPFFGLKITMQSYAYKPASFEGRTGWEKRISNLKGQMTKYFTVKTAEMDLNNDGTVDRVVEVSSFDERINRRIYINYPLNEFNNLAVDWFSKERPLAVLGELFLYENRTFVLSVHHFEKSTSKYIWQYLVGEPNPSPMRDSGGLIVSPSICNIVVLSNN